MQRKRPAAAPETLGGRVVASHGRRYSVELGDGSVLECMPRGKKSEIACGDRVRIARTEAGQGVVESIDPRSTLLYRSDAYRQKLVAANVSLVVIVVAAVPTFYEDLVNRCLAAAEHGAMRALIALNKDDLPLTGEVSAKLELYRGLGYRVETLSAKRDPSALGQLLRGHVSVLVGQSGMGKSTIINGLVSSACARVAEISTALDSGRHITTHAQLYHLDADSDLIDSPGMQEFGLYHLSSEELAAAFVEFRPWLGSCRFRDCRHLAEPGCAVSDAAGRGEIPERRLSSYRRLVQELRQRGEPLAVKL
jgi:ribosome biogenesis GTPase